MKLHERARILLSRLSTWGESREEHAGLPLQTGALPWRLGLGNCAEVLLVTGRKSGRWMIPKGWPIRGKSLAKAAAQEAFEEAGVKGTITGRPLGTFRHTKQHLLVGPLEVNILVHALSVQDEFETWPEQRQRRRKWFSLDDAAGRVDSKELGAMIRGLGNSVDFSRAKQR